MNSIQLINLSTGYGTRLVSSGLNAALAPGTLTCFAGPNGAGKSTLMRTIAGFQKPLAGRVVIEGKDITAYTPSELASHVSVVLTERPQVDNMTVAELVALGRAPYTGFLGRLSAADRALTDRALALTGIAPLAPRRVATLSDGECQKAMIAKAIAQDAPIILLDEPTAFLDYPGKVDTLRLLARLAADEGKTILLTIHDLDLALRLAQNMWLMTPAPDGTASLTAGTPTHLASTGALSATFPSPGLTFPLTPTGPRVEIMEG